MKARTRLTLAAGVVIVVLTVVAFWLSYAHLQEVAAGNGLGGSPVRSWAWPATLDLFIVAGEIMMLVAALARRRDPWAISLTVVGSVGSIGLNVYGVGPSALLIEYIVAAVPPTAALLAFGALMRQVHAAVVEPAQEAAQEPTAGTVEDSAGVPRWLVDQVQAGQLVVADGSVEKAPQESTVNDFAAIVDSTVEKLAEETGTPLRFLKPAAADMAQTQDAINRLTEDLEAARQGFTVQHMTAPLEEVLDDVEGNEDADHGFEDDEDGAEEELVEVIESPRGGSTPSVDDLADAVQSISMKGQDLNGRTLGDYFNVSDRTGRRYLKVWQAA